MSIELERLKLMVIVKDKRIEKYKLLEAELQNEKKAKANLQLHCENLDSELKKLLDEIGELKIENEKLRSSFGNHDQDRQIMRLEMQKKITTLESTIRFKERELEDRAKTIENMSKDKVGLKEKNKDLLE